MSAGFKVLIWCNDCTNEDPQGCGDGQPWMLIGDDGKPEVFLTETQAETFGTAYVRGCGPWRYEVHTAGEDLSHVSEDGP